jgi:hypothetical protein
MYLCALFPSLLFNPFIIMRKTTLLAAVLVLGLLFVSCEKGDQYTPKNRIDRICYSESTTFQKYVNNEWTDIHTNNTPKYVSEIWDWDGKKLKSINHYNEKGELEYTENFEYNGKRLVSVSGSKWVAGRWIISYEKGNVSSIDGYVGTEKRFSYVFSHDNGKVTKIAVTNFDAKKADANPLPINIFRFFIPNPNIQSLKEMMASIQSYSDTKEIESYDINFEWTGNNISKMTVLKGATTIKTVNYTYDEKTNPFFGLFDFSEYNESQMMSENNITREVTESSMHEERDYTYTYEEDLPTTQTSSYIWSSDENTRILFIGNHTYDYKK